MAEKAALVGAGGGTGLAPGPEAVLKPEQAVAETDRVSQAAATRAGCQSAVQAAKSSSAWTAD